MESKENIDQHEEGKVLSSIHKENVFSVPTDYFDRLPTAVSGRIHSGSGKSIAIRPVFSISALAAAACLALLFIFYSGDPSLSADEFALSESDIDYILEHPELCDLDPSDISDAYLSMVPPGPEDEFDDASLPDDDIEWYLQENTDLSTLINEP